MQLAVAAFVIWTVRDTAMYEAAIAWALAGIFLSSLPHDRMVSALSGLGVAIAPQLLVADDIAAGRLLAPWGFVETRHQLGLWVPERQPQGPAQQLADWLGKALQQADA